MPKPVFRAVLGRMQFTFHATRRTHHGASRLVQAMSSWVVKTRRAPSRHSRGARVYGHRTTAMHKRSTPPPPIFSAVALPPLTIQSPLQPLLVSTSECCRYVVGRCHAMQSMPSIASVTPVCYVGAGRRRKFPDTTSSAPPPLAACRAILPDRLETVYFPTQIIHH